MRAGKKYQRQTHLGKKISDGATWKRSQRWTSETWQKSQPAAILGKNQQGVQSEKEVSDSLVRASKKHQWHAQPWKKSTTGANWEKVSKMRKLKKNSPTDSCELTKEVSERNILEKKISDRRNLKKEVSDARDMWKKESATCAIWEKISNGCDLWKDSAAGSTWKRRQQRARATWKKSQWHVQPGKKLATSTFWQKISDGRFLKKNSVTGSAWKRSQQRTPST